MISKSRIKQIQGLHNARSRKEEQLFIAEGEKTVKELLEQLPSGIEEIFATSEFLEKEGALIRKSGVLFSEVKEDELSRISTLKTANKVLAVCRYLDVKEEVGPNDTSISIFLDEIKDPGNFGTLIRLADWFGVAVVFCSHGSCDLYNSKVIQATMGAFIRVKVVYTDLSVVIKENNFKNVYGAVMNGANLYQENLGPGLLVIGNESTGISSENLKLLTRSITIPSHSSNGTESLNAAMAGAIILSEFFRKIKI